MSKRDNYFERNRGYISDELQATISKRRLLPCDLILDTIDYLSLPAIVTLHDTANALKKPALSALSAGWGALVLAFDPRSPENLTFRDLIQIPRDLELQKSSYMDYLVPFVERIAPLLDPEIIREMQRALSLMKDGNPCPASQVAAGASAVAALANTLVVQMVAGEYVSLVPNIYLLNLKDLTPHSVSVGRKQEPLRSHLREAS